MKKQIKKTLAVLSILIFVSPVFVLAQGGGTTGGGSSQQITIKNPASGLGDDLLTAITDILNKIVLPIGAVICVIWIIYAGLTFVTAQGKPAEIQKAQQRLLWALIGTGILLGAVGISNAVRLTVNALFV